MLYELRLHDHKGNPLGFMPRPSLAHSQLAKECGASIDYRGLRAGLCRAFLCSIVNHVLTRESLVVVDDDDSWH